MDSVEHRVKAVFMWVSYISLEFSAFAFLRPKWDEGISWSLQFCILCYWILLLQTYLPTYIPIDRYVSVWCHEVECYTYVQSPSEVTVPAQVTKYSLTLKTTVTVALLQPKCSQCVKLSIHYVI